MVLVPYMKKDTTEAKEGARGFPGGAVVENLPANAGDMGSSQIGRASCRERV